MSQIFDALLRSEAERTGNGREPEVEATELLRYVEGEVASKWTSSNLLDQQENPAPIEHKDQLLTGSILDFSQQSNTKETSSVVVLNEQRSNWNQFQTRAVAGDSENAPVCYTNRDNPAAEAFRLLGVRLRDLRQNRPLKTLLITSTVPREGKSTIASNLACALAQKNGERILLLEGDIRRPTLSQIFDLGSAPGICELLQEQRTLAQSIYYLEGPNIWLLPAGHAPDTPLELLQPQRLISLAGELAALFDWIIIDAPPILPLADTSIWSRNADGVLLVTRSGTTEKQQLERGIQALEPGKLIGALLNSCRASVYTDYYYKSQNAPASTAKS